VSTMLQHTLGTTNRLEDTLRSITLQLPEIELCSIYYILNTKMEKEESLGGEAFLLQLRNENMYVQESGSNRTGWCLEEVNERYGCQSVLLSPS